MGASSDRWLQPAEETALTPDSGVPGQPRAGGVFFSLAFLAQALQGLAFSPTALTVSLQHWAFSHATQVWPFFGHLGGLGAADARPGRARQGCRQGENREVIDHVPHVSFCGRCLWSTMSPGSTSLPSADLCAVARNILPLIQPPFLKWAFTFVPSESSGSVKLRLKCP